MLGVLDQVQVDVLADVFKIQGTVRVRLDVAFGAFDRFPRGEIFRVDFVRRVGVFDGVPHFEKHQRERAHGRALEADAGVLPITVGVGDVEVFVGEVVAAGVSDLPVDNREFAVIAVVHKYIEEGNDRIEIPALDTVGGHFLDKALVDEANAADVVVKQAHLDPFLNLLSEDVVDAGEGFCVFDREVFHKDKMLGAAQIGLHRLEGLIRHIVKLNGRIVVDRVGAVMADVVADIGQRRIGFPKLFGDGSVLRHHRVQQLVDGRVALAHGLGDVDPPAERVQ